MRPKLYKGKVYGAELTAAEKKAMKIEINRQLVESSCAKISRETAMEYATETLENAAIMLVNYGYNTKLGI